MRTSVLRTTSSLIAAALLVAACNMTSPASDSPPPTQAPSNGIAGEWRLQAEDSLLWCRFAIAASDTGEGRATDYGCIDLDGFAGFIRQWKRQEGRIEFYSATRDGPVASVWRDGRDVLRGNLVPSGRKIVLTRK